MSTYSSIGFVRNDHKAFAFGHIHPSDQDVYLEKANETIDLMTKIMKRSIENGTSSFSNCIKIASNSRRKIAQNIQKRNKTLEGKVYHEESCEFGLPRLKENPNVYHLLLGGVYSETSGTVARSISQSLSRSPVFDDYIQSQLGIASTKHGIEEIRPEEDPQKFHLDIEWEFLTKEQSEEHFDTPSELLRHNAEFMVRFNKFKETAIAQQNFFLILTEGEKIAELGQATIRDLKQHNPELYEKNWNLTLIDIFKEQLPKCIEHNISTYAIGKLKYHFAGNEPRILTKYITHIPYTSGDSKADILRKLECRPTVMLGHQDVTDIQSTLEDAKRLYDKAMSWTSEEGEDSLKNTVGSMMYLLAHNHRDARGTAAESEWIEHSIYAAHNFILISEEKRMPDLIAFSYFTVEEFLTAYKASFGLRAIA